MSMGLPPPRDKSLGGVLQDTRERLGLVERRLALGGGGGGGDVSAVVAGTIMPFGGAAAPTGWLLCDGSAVSRSTYAVLFSAIGTAFGAGDGSSTFNLPNLKGRVPVGQDTAQTEFDVLGETGGAKTHTLTVAEMPSHSHRARIGNVSPGDGSGFRYSNNDTGLGSVQIEATGGGTAHNNLQPYTVVNYIISIGAGSGSGGGSGVVTAGPGTQVTGAGTVGAPYVVEAEGLIRVRPTNVVNGALQGNGDVSFTAVATGSAVSLDGVFTTAYRHYRIIIEADISASSAVGLRIRVGGVDNTTNNYGCGYLYNSSNTAVAVAYNILNYFATSGVGVTRQFIVIDLQEPAFAVVSHFLSASTGLGGISSPGTRMNSFFGIGQAFDGISVFATTAGAITGRISVYGYN